MWLQHQKVLRKMWLIRAKVLPKMWFYITLPIDNKQRRQYYPSQTKKTPWEAPVYWVSESNQAEIDFIIQHDAELIPIEVKAETNLQAKSLKLFCKKFQCPRAVRISMAHWNEQKIPAGDDNQICNLLNLPLFATHQLISILDSGQTW